MVGICSRTIRAAYRASLSYQTIAGSQPLVSQRTSFGNGADVDYTALVHGGQRARKGFGLPQKRKGRTTALEGEPVLRVARSQLDSEIGDRLERGQQLLERPVGAVDDVDELRRALNTWDEFNEQLLRSRFSTGTVANGYRRVGIGGLSRDPQKALDWVRMDISRQLRKLESIRQQLPLYASSEVEVDDVRISALGSLQGTKIFVVHGHDGDTKHQVVEFLETVTGERPIVLHEQPDSGRTIIEKFEDHASEAGFAVVLLTADDLGRSKLATDLNSRARQNVVLELGFFIGRLGRSRVVALHESGVELPSDLNGLLYKPLSGNWHTELAGELIAAEIAVDVRKPVGG